MIERNTYTLNGQRMTVGALAQLAGCTLGAMQQRLRAGGMTPEAAVAAGAKLPPGGGRRGKFRINGQRISAAGLARMAGCTECAMVERLKRLTPEQAVAGGARMTGSGNWGQRPTVLPAAKPAKKKPPPMRAAFDAEQPAIVPAGVKRTIAQTPLPRFHVEPDQVPLLFRAMRPGQYEPTGSAIERQYGGGQG